MVLARLPRGQFFTSALLDLRGGLNTSKTDELIEDNELSAVSNYIPDPTTAGMIIKREGLTEESSEQTEAITSIYQGAHGEYFTTSTTIRDFAGASLLDSLTSSIAPSWATMGSRDIFVNGAQKKFTTDGTTFSDLGGTPPNFTNIELFNNHLFGGGHDAGKIRWSDLGNPQVWDVTHEIDLTGNSLNNFVGMVRYRDVLVVFCDFSFYHIAGFGSKQISVAYSSFEEGATSHRAILSTPLGLFWWSKDGLTWSRDGFNIDKPSVRKISRSIDALDKNQFHRVHGIYDPNVRRVMFWCHSQGASAYDTIIYYYPDEDSFWVGNGGAAAMGASGVAVVEGKAKLYLGSAATGGHLFEHTGDDDNEDPVAARLATKRLSPGGPVSIKRCQRLIPRVLVEGVESATYGVYFNDNESASMSWTLDFSGISGSFILGTSQLGVGVLGSFPLQDTQIYPRHKFNKLKHSFSEEAGTRIKIRGFIAEGVLVHA